MTQIRFATGMPRAGTRLLMNLFAQNPDIHAAVPSALVEVLFSNRNSWEIHPEHKSMDQIVMEAKRLNVFQAIFNSYHLEVTQPTIIDFSRGWAGYINLLIYVLGEAPKIVVSVRDLTEILSSLELLYQNKSMNSQWPGEAQNYFLFQTAMGRCQYWMQHDQLVGLAYNRVREAIRLHSKKLHIVHYEELCRYPESVLKDIYSFLELEPFEHDFDHVEQVTSEQDDVHGVPGLHKIRPKVESTTREAKKRSKKLLGREVVNKYRGPYPWSDT